MVRGPAVGPVRTRARSFLLLAAGIAALAGCEGDTLYDVVPEGVDPPSVEIVEPASGAEVLAGRSIPVRVVATDPEGIASLTLRAQGVVQTTIVLNFTPPRTSVELDTVIAVPSGAQGNLQLSATSVNARGVPGSAPSVTLRVSLQDNTPPDVGVQIQAGPRLEQQDSVVVLVSARDNPGGSGIARVGMTAIVRNTARPDTQVVTHSEQHAPARQGLVQGRFTFPPDFVDVFALPDTLLFEVHGYAVDDFGHCSAAVGPNPEQKVACDTLAVSGSEVIVAAAVPETREVIAVVGRTSLVPGGGVVPDLLVDSLRERVYVSNLSRNKLQTLTSGPGTWGQEVFVGAEPWGLAVNTRGDTLYVANSGGTSISFVSLAGTPREDLNRRYVTRNTPLFEITKGTDADGFTRLSGIFIDFSDRPQFIAQDASNRLLFSTRPTTAAPRGTIRIAERQPAWQEPETRILTRLEDIVFTQFGVDTVVVALANVDSVTIFTAVGAPDRIEIYDHRNGFPNTLVRSGIQPLEAALDSLDRHPDSDIVWSYGTWNVEAMSLQDTTYVAASRDRRWVAFGEGAAGIGRITLWDATASQIHSRLLVADLVNNASERVRGVDLNRDGTLGAARGLVASYFFSTDLRLQGSVGEVAPGGSGTVLHPDHPGYGQGTASSPVTVAFLGTGNNTIKVLDTVHFTERGEIHIRDQVVGPFRAGPPLSTDNGGLGRNCAGPQCVVVKLYGVTDAGGVVVVDVLRQDILPLQ